MSVKPGVTSGWSQAPLQLIWVIVDVRRLYHRVSLRPWVISYPNERSLEPGRSPSRAQKAFRKTRVSGFVVHRAARVGLIASLSAFDHRTCLGMPVRAAE